MDLDMQRVKDFSEELIELFGAGMLTVALDVGDRTGLLEAAAQGPGTAAEIAARADVEERTAREWLAALTTGGIVHHEDGVFTLPAEHAVLLTGETFYNLTPLARVVAATGGQTERIAQAVADGEGIDHQEFERELTDKIDAMSRRRFDAMLVDAYLPTTGITDRLDEGGRIADVGCGAGHAANLMAAAFPQADVLGVDVSADALERARAEASDMDLDNVTFVQHDAAEVDQLGPLDLVTAFDVIHDLPQPHKGLDAIHSSLRDDGRLLMYETSAPSDLDAQTELGWAPLMYGMSLAHCIQVARAGGGTGVGTMWGQEQATAALAESGFAAIETHPAPGDPMNAIYVARPA